jgi:hypothetical protein
MSEEKTLDEALDESEAWGNQVSDAIDGRTPEEVAAYFAQAQARLEATIGRPLNLPVRSAPQPSVQ